MLIGFIGGGVMGEAIIKSILAKKIATAKQITASDISEPRRKYLNETYGIKTTAVNIEAVEGANCVVLATKPQELSRISADIKGKLKPSQLVISIMAGITLDTLKTELSHESIVRSMPNMPAQIGAGMTVWTESSGVNESQKEMARSLLSAPGEEIYVKEEKYLDMATAISGSGPAYIFMILETLTDAGVHIGLPRALAEKLAIETTIGSAMTARVTKKHPAELKNMVTSPGGTTTEGLLKLESGGLRSLILQAVISAYEKAKKIASQK
jgi:pyrroline-5-carboxylate reductase